MTAENGELWKRLNSFDGKALEVVVSEKQFQANVSSLTEKWDASTVKCEELAVHVQFMPGLAKEARLFART